MNSKENTHFRSISLASGIDPMILGFKQNDLKMKKLNMNILNTKDQLIEKIERLTKLKAIKHGELVIRNYASKMKDIYDYIKEVKEEQENARIRFENFAFHQNEKNINEMNSSNKNNQVK